ncbi:MAG TPA: methylated-DNA--[protein]-cysteine S-methyltransferase [Stellaceae bacterium]|nr:methylated-DNA--[protein]-cysteine S-methyltransferase [Stellaceae bacterium]
MPRLSIDSPLGRLTLREEDGRLTAVDWRGKHAATDETPLLLEAKRQLDAYFRGELRAFDLPLSPAGPPLEQQVWRLMSAIPYGQTRSYGELARALNATAQDIGQACGRNPLPVVIPCHRVMAAEGRLGGYSGGRGIETKLKLLTLEGALLV